MEHKPITIDQLRSLINKGEASDPLVFLEAVMTGQDPRQHSRIYELVMEIEEFSDGQPSKEDWSEVVDFVITHCAYRIVNLSESQAAAKTLAEYIHPKRKQVEKTDANSGGSVSHSPLSGEEVDLFLERFNDEF